MPFLTKSRIHTFLGTIYIGFNPWLLPFGLVYLHLLSPLFYAKLFIKTKGKVLWPLLIFLIPFDLVHLYQGVVWSSFALSNALIIVTFIVVRMIHYSLKKTINLPVLFRNLLVINFGLTLLAIMLFFTPWKEEVWYLLKFTNNVVDLPRLKLFTYEASYYSLAITPLVIYYLLKVLLGQTQTKKQYILFLALFPLALSLSMGVIGSICIAFVALLILKRKALISNQRVVFGTISALFLGVAVFLLLLLFYPNNPLFLRLLNIITLSDSSMMSRTYYSAILAEQLISERSHWFGIGLGQIKELAPLIMSKYYGHFEALGVVRIPNAILETYTLFGIVGLVVRMSLQTVLFYTQKVSKNYFQLLCFVFMFVYQFTGSYFVNIVEYTIWIFAFTHLFPNFDVPKNNLKSKQD